MKRFTLNNKLNAAGDSWDVYRTTLEIPHLRGVEAEYLLVPIWHCFWMLLQ